MEPWISQRLKKLSWCLCCPWRVYNMLAALLYYTPFANCLPRSNTSCKVCTNCNRFIVPEFSLQPYNVCFNHKPVTKWTKTGLSSNSTQYLLGRCPTSQSDGPARRFSQLVDVYEIEHEAIFCDESGPRAAEARDGLETSVCSH